ncbi:MAG: hypothetical protein AAF938_09250 [Myxococcota bacterium]
MHRLEGPGREIAVAQVQRDERVGVAFARACATGHDDVVLDVRRGHGPYRETKGGAVAAAADHDVPRAVAAVRGDVRDGSAFIDVQVVRLRAAGPVLLPWLDAFAEMLLMTGAFREVRCR